MGWSWAGHGLIMHKPRPRPRPGPHCLALPYAMHAPPHPPPHHHTHTAWPPHLCDALGQFAPCIVTEVYADGVLHISSHHRVGQKQHLACSTAQNSTARPRNSTEQPAGAVMSLKWSCMDNAKTRACEDVASVLGPVLATSLMLTANCMMATVTAVTARLSLVTHTVTGCCC
jgi:hypothetical protein